MPLPGGSQQLEQGSGLWPRQHLHSQTGATLRTACSEARQGSMGVLSAPTLRRLAAAPGGGADGVTAAAGHCKAGLAYVKQATLDNSYLTRQHVTWIAPLPPAATLLGAALARSASPAQLQCRVTWQPAVPESAVKAGWALLQYRQGCARCEHVPAAQHNTYLLVCSRIQKQGGMHSGMCTRAHQTSPYSSALQCWQHSSPAACISA